MRAKATIAATLVVAVTLVLSAVTLRVLLRRSLQDNLDASARVRAAELATLVQGDAVPDELAVHTDEDALTQIVGPSGEIIAASANLAGAPPLGAIPASSKTSPFTTRLGPADDPDLFRVAVTTVGSAAGTTTIFVGSSLDPVNESVDATTGSSWSASPSSSPSWPSPPGSWWGERCDRWS